MRRLKFPIAIPYRNTDDVLSFEATHEELRPLGEPGYIETDGSRTAGGREFFWGFETDDGLRFQIQWAEPTSCMVVSDPPDLARTESALRTLGLEGIQFTPRPQGAPVEALARYQARGAVWLFTPEGMHQPTAVFSRKQLADQWLAQNPCAGTLQAYPLDLSLYDIERRLDPRSVPPPDSPEARRFVESSGERYTYREGRQLQEEECWQLWRQDDHGTRFLMAEFDERNKAEEEMQRMEARGHKQTYWVSRKTV